MRVATLNVWGRSGDWPARRAVLREGLRALAPDLLALQETVVDEDGDQVRELLGDELHVVHSQKRAANGTGTSIASRWPPRAVHELDLAVAARDDDFPSSTVVAVVDVPGLEGAVLLANHFPTWQVHLEVERERQAVLAVRALDELRGDGDHVVLLGDLDADPEAASVRFLCGRQSLEGASTCFRDAWERAHPGEPGATFSPAENPLVADEDWPYGRIDHVLVRCAEHGGPTLQVRACERIFDAPVDGTWASDHFGLVADLEAPRA